MLKREVAEKRLEEQKVKNWEKAHVAACSALPAKLKDHALGLGVDAGT